MKLLTRCVAWVVMSIVLGGTSFETRLGGSEEPFGRTAILKDDLPASGAASSPDYLAGILQEAGFSTAFLNCDQLAKAGELNHERFDVLVLPYGASFPVNAADNFRAFLRSGGKFLSTGGYAFDNLLERTSGGWRAYQPQAPPRLDGAAWFYDIPASVLRGHGRLKFHGFLKADGVSGPGFAHFSVYQIASDGSLPTWRDLCQVRGSREWKEYEFAFDVHPSAVTVSLRAGLYRCRGTAWFEGVKITDEAGKAILEANFDPSLSPDGAVSGKWWRSHRELCTWQTQVSHSGRGAMQVRLDFETPRVERLNTRHGRPEDGLEVEPTQLGIFQADYPLERARSVAAASGQAVVSPALRVNDLVEGWAACGVIGYDQARWVPLVNAYDRYGRLRGAAGGMLRQYSGPWAGSSWAFFGVTNRDLFAPAQPGMAEAFVAIMRSLTRDTYFASLTTERSCYRQGELVKLFLPVFNGGRKERHLRVDLEIHPGEPGPPEETSRRGAWLRPAAAKLTMSLRAAPGRTNLVTAEWNPQFFRDHFYYLVARLWEGTNQIDTIESGFVVQDPKAIRSGPKLSYRDNYLRLGKRPLFLFGTDDWGYVFNTTRETPLQWLRDMRQRRDLGVMIYENLQPGLPRSPAIQEDFFRKLDGLVQLAQEYGQIYFAGLLIGYNAAASDADLGAQREYCRDFARRYANVPGLIYYLNGDYRCELSEAVTPQWNEFLRQRYGSAANLREAWGRFGPSRPLGQIPAEEYHDWEQVWDDVSVLDRNSFRTWLMRRWNSALLSGIREFDCSHPSSGEFYQLPHSGVDLPAGIDGLDLANFGFFEKPGADLAKFPALCLYNDQRARGKSGGPGEYGVKTHPAWGDGKDYGYHTARSREDATELFLAIPHYAFGLGASRIHNWCWKDDAHRVFPWGMVYPCDGVPKDTAYVHRNLSFLFRQFAPVYDPSEVYVLTPDSHRLGGGKWKVTDGILTSLELALATHVRNLGVLNEQWLEIPRSAKAIFYPLPFCPPDEAFRKVLEWVKGGGVLCVSGDLSYDELRRRSRVSRLEELCGVRFVAECYPNISVSPTNAADQPCVRVEPQGAQVLQRAADGSVLVVENRLGRGHVVYTTDPIELHSTAARRGQDLSLYQRVLESAGIAPLAVVPNNPRLHVMQVPLRDGGKVWVLFNTDPSQPCQTYTLGHGKVPIDLMVARNRPALLWFDRAGHVRAIESQGECVAGGERICLDETRGVLMSLDGKDVRRSNALLLMPLQPGRVQWRSRATWTEPVIETGEFSCDRWQALDTRSTRGAQDHMEVVVSPEQALSLLLVCDKSSVGHWRSSLERGLTDPASLP